MRPHREVTNMQLSNLHPLLKNPQAKYCGLDGGQGTLSPSTEGFEN
jgi:hypothetical protein